MIVDGEEKILLGWSLNPERLAPGDWVGTYVYNGADGYDFRYQTKLELAGPDPVVVQIEYPNRATNAFDYAFEFDIGITS